MLENLATPLGGLFGPAFFDQQLERLERGREVPPVPAIRLLGIRKRLIGSAEFLRRATCDAINIGRLIFVFDEPFSDFQSTLVIARCTHCFGERDAHQRR